MIGIPSGLLLNAPDYRFDEFWARQHQEVEEIRKEVLTLQEELILRWRFGLNGENPLTLDGTARKVGVTRERVRQLQGKAIEKLRRRLSTPVPG